MNRRDFLAGFATAVASGTLSGPALAQQRVPTVTLADLRGTQSALDHGVRPGALDNQSAAFQAMVDAAAANRTPLFLPPGTYVISNIRLPDGADLAGIPGATHLVYGGDGHFLSAETAERITLSGLMIDGANRWTGDATDGLVDLRGVLDVRLGELDVRGAGQDGIHLEQCGGSVRDCRIYGAARFGIFSVEGRALTITGNSVYACGNGGIIVHRWSQGENGTIITGNRIEAIKALEGGTGQWGNAINLFRTDGVTVSGNIIRDAAFSAIRANSARRILISGNQCIGSGETAIYAEFSFENAVIADNIIDSAASGIAVTNLDQGGRGAVVSGNIVRNIHGRGPYPADPPGFGTGIGVEADTTVTGNLIDGATRFGINCGWGPFLRDVAVSGNVIRDVTHGIGVTVADGAGSVVISGNAIAARDGAIRAHRWSDVLDGDLATARRLPDHVTLLANRFG